MESLSLLDDVLSKLATKTAKMDVIKDDKCYLKSVDTIDDIEMYLKSKDSINIICFSTTWCINCKQIKPILSEYAKILKDNEVNFIEVLMDKSDDLEDYALDEWNVSTIPHTIIVKGSDKNEYNGSDVDKLKEFLTKYLNVSLDVELKDESKDGMFFIVY